MPIYETAQHLAEERSVIERLCRRWHCQPKKLEMAEGLDFRLSWASPFTYCEAKCRDLTFGFRRELGEGYNISLLKIQHARRYWQAERLPTVLAIRFDDGRIRACFDLQHWQGREIIWGRRDRPNDPSAIEPTAVIPWDSFREIDA